MVEARFLMVGARGYKQWENAKMICVVVNWSSRHQYDV